MASPAAAAPAHSRAVQGWNSTKRADQAASSTAAASRERYTIRVIRPLAPAPSSWMLISALLRKLKSSHSGLRSWKRGCRFRQATYSAAAAMDNTSAAQAASTAP